MVINGILAGRPVTISIKASCLTVSLQLPGEAEVLSYDGSGRLWTALLQGISYRRGLDGKVVAKWQADPAINSARQAAGESRQRRWLSPEEARALEEQARQRLKMLLAAFQSGKVLLDQPMPDAGLSGLSRAVRFDETASLADIARYHRVYRPVGILPPDQYMAVVLQLTEGCAFNTCTFCTFYRDRRFRIKGLAEFREHAEQVREFLGDGLSLRRTLFLGDANALIAPMDRLLPLVEAVHQVYDVQALGGLYAFLDGFSAEKKTARDYQRLRELGLKRVYIGLESGNDDLLRFLKKPGKAADAVAAVQAMKAGGVAVGVIVLLGAGGQAYARQHVAETITTLNAMRLDLDDLIYFSELVTSEGMAYAREAYEAGLQPLEATQRTDQAEAIEGGLKFSRRGGVPHISRYDIREFVY